MRLFASVYLLRQQMSSWGVIKDIFCMQRKKARSPLTTHMGIPDLEFSPKTLGDRSLPRLCSPCSQEGGDLLCLPVKRASILPFPFDSTRHG